MLLCSALLAIPAGPASLPGAVRQRCLANGLDVILLRVEGAPLVSVWSGVRAGSADERPGITGAAHWCARMAFKGTERYEPGRMHELLERAGAAWNACTWLDQTCFFGTLPKGALDLVLDIEAQRMAAALFLPETVETERAAIISELQTLENDPEKLLDIETTAAAFAAHPYRWPAIGRRRDVEKTTREELYRFYRRAYCPSNATLVVAGDFDEEQTLRSIRRAFGALPPGEPLEPSRTEELAQRGERRVPMTRLGARIAERLVQAQSTAAMLTTFNEVDLKAVNELRARYKDKFEKEHGARLGFMSFFVKACVEALRRFPVVNASVDGNDVIYHEYYDIGVAVSTERGLIVPVLRNADQMGFGEIEQAVVGYATRAREGQLTLEELTGGTFTITNRSSEPRSSTSRRWRSSGSGRWRSGWWSRPTPTATITW